MRISELSEQTGVSVASIKYYTREGLLPLGERTGYNQTEYSATHVARLRLIRALVDVAGLTIVSAKGVIGAIDDHQLPIDYAFGIAQQSIPTHSGPPTEASLERIRQVMRDRGWETYADNPGIALSAGILDVFSDIDRSDISALLPRYAAAASEIAEADLDVVGASGSRERMTETVILGTVLGDALLAGLRRIAQENLSHRRYDGPPIPDENKEPRS